MKTEPEISSATDNRAEVVESTVLLSDREVWRDFMIEQLPTSLTDLTKQAVSQKLPLLGFFDFLQVLIQQGVLRYLDQEMKVLKIVNLRKLKSYNLR